jgi:tetratricopeptide (TPR) repeat protein
MKMSNRILVAAAALAVVVLSGSLTGCRKLEARDNLNKGVAAFKNAKYPDAVQFFTKAVDLDPTFVTARLYLATAYSNQYIPGADSPENVEMAKNALENFQKVLDADPKNATAIESIGSLYYQESQGTAKLDDKLARLENARQWYQRRFTRSASLPGPNGIPTGMPPAPSLA